MSISQFSFLASSLVFSLVDEGRRRMGERGCYDAPGTATHALICKPAKESPTAAPLLPANISGMDSASQTLTYRIPSSPPGLASICWQFYVECGRKVMGAGII